MNTLLSLVCPIYRAKDYLPALVDSLTKGCNSSAIQVIFVNDCSPDESMAICRSEIVQRADMVMFEATFIDRSENGGPAAARNTGIAQARGRYIGFIDSDDLVSPDYFASLAPLLSEGRHDIVEFGFEEFTDHPSRHASRTAPVMPAQQDSPYHNGFFAWSRVYKADLVRAVPFLEGRLYEDVRFVAEVFGKTSAIARVAIPLVHYRQREGSITASRGRRYAEQLISLIEGTSAGLPTHAKPAHIVTLTAKKSLVILLKGARIEKPEERRAFFEACRRPLAQVTALLRTHHNGLFAACYEAISGALVHALAPSRIA